MYICIFPTLYILIFSYFRGICVINRRKTSKQFKLERGTQQGDPISTYLFVIVVE